MLVRELIEFLETLEPDSLVQIVNEAQTVGYDILEAVTCDDDRDFCDLIISDEAFGIEE